MRPLILILLWIISGTAVNAAEQGLLEDSTPLQIEIGGRNYALESFIARPAHGSRLPVVLFVHGSAASDDALRALNLASDRQWARTLATRGWLAVSVARRGYGRSEGSAFLDIGTCQEPAAAAYLDHHAVDIEAALDAIGKRADADMSRVLLIGKSVGGAVALDVASRQKVRITAVINVSGGVSAFTPKLAVNPDCDLLQSDVVWNFARFGAASRIPTIWFYAENDPWFSPAFVGRMLTAYTAAGGFARLVMLPAFAPDGHDLYHAYEGQEQILPKIDQFLSRSGLPTWDHGFAGRLLASLKPEQRQLGLEYLKEAPAQKALAVGDGDSSVAWSASDGESIDSARATALRNCEADAHGPCHIVAENFDLVGTAKGPTLAKTAAR
jgi:pimeloyl-ACP methyl ester carboxylesterase